MDSSWVTEFIQNGLDRWSGTLTEIWDLVSTSPENFRGGGIWSVIVDVNNVLQGFGLGLLILFWAMGVFKSTISLQDFKRPEKAISLLLRFGLCKVAVSGAMDLMTNIFKISLGTVTTVVSRVGSMSQTLTVPSEVVDQINDLGFVQSIPVWLMAAIGGLIMMVLSVYILFVVYGRFFRLYMYTAVAPIPLATFAGEPAQSIGRSFVKSYAGVCMEGFIIVIACVIFSAYAGAPPDLSGSASAIAYVTKYLLETIMNMLVLVGAIKMSNHIIREMMGG